MPNERLRSQIAVANMSLADVAANVGVDPKTVERWITTGRVPHRTHRWKTAALLGSDEAVLWPEVADAARTRAASAAELVQLYPTRSAVPPALWGALLGAAAERVEVLVYAGLFLVDGAYPELPEALAQKARGGAAVRLALGDPGGDAVRLRGREEGIRDGLAARVRMSLAYLTPALGTAGVQARLHDTTLYASLYRFDDDMLVNTHVYGAPAAQSPVLHLRRVPGGRMFDHYATSLDRVWASARSLTPVAA